MNLQIFLYYQGLAGLITELYTMYLGFFQLCVNL